MAETSIFDEFMVPENGSAKNAVPPSGDKSIFDEFMVPENKIPEPTAPVSAQKQALPLGRNIPGAPSYIPGVAEGYLNVAQTVNRLFKHSDKNFARTEEVTNQLRQNLKTDYGEGRGYEAGKISGEIATSAPLIPGATIAQGVKTAFGAMPTITGAGVSAVTRAAPWGRRLAASMTTGGVVGGEFGALTHAANEENTLAENVGKNALAGAVGNPVIQAGAKVAGGVIPFFKKVLNAGSINFYANQNGMAPWAVKNVLTELENSGLTVAEARQVLQKLGPQATLADLDPALQQEVGGLALEGGRTTSILKNRFADRAKTADDEAHKIMESRLGPKPDVVVQNGKLSGAEADIIHKAAEASVSGERAAAYANPTKLSLYSTIGHINKELEGAVGAEANALKEIKGYMYKTTKDAQGNDVQSIKTSVEDLHKVRKGIDDKRGEGLPSNALIAVQELRNRVDAQLKTIPEMLAHDTKFSEKMKLKEGLQIGYEALGDKVSHQTFEKTFNAATPELQETIKKGLRAAIADKMQSAANGELAGAQQLFKKKANTREKLKLAFGANGEEVLDALTKQATLRATEQIVATGSRTAGNQQILAKYKAAPHDPSVFMEAVKGFGGDVIAGTGGPIAASRAGAQASQNIRHKLQQRRLAINAETSADLFSRQGKDLDTALNVFDRVQSIQNAISSVKLPTTYGKYARDKLTLAAPTAGDPIVDFGKKGATFGKNISQHWINQLAPYLE